MVAELSYVSGGVLRYPLFLTNIDNFVTIFIDSFYNRSMLYVILSRSHIMYMLYNFIIYYYTCSSARVFVRFSFNQSSQACRFSLHGLGSGF